MCGICVLWTVYLGDEAQAPSGLVAGVDLLQQLGDLALRVGCGVLDDLEGGGMAVEFEDVPG